LSVLPALLVMAWLLAGLPLLLAGRFDLVLMLVAGVPLAVVLVGGVLWWVPGRWRGWWWWRWGSGRISWFFIRSS
jgi:hypothetical protein